MWMFGEKGVERLISSWSEGHIWLFHNRTGGVPVVIRAMGWRGATCYILKGTVTIVGRKISKVVTRKSKYPGVHGIIT
jgi:hypothetical protein